MSASAWWPQQKIVNFEAYFKLFWVAPLAQTVKNPPAKRETWVRSPGWEDTLEECMATHSSILAWRIPWIEEPDGLQSIGLQRVRHNWSDLVCTHTHLQYSCLENPIDRGALWATVHGVTKSQTWLSNFTSLTMYFGYKYICPLHDNYTLKVFKFKINWPNLHTKVNKKYKQLTRKLGKAHRHIQRIVNSY